MSLLVTPADQSLLAQRAAFAWNWAHEGQDRAVRLAIVTDRKPNRIARDGPVAVFGGNRVEEAPQRTSFDAVLKELDALGLREVVLAEGLPEQLDKALGQRGFFKKFPGQLTGYWFNPSDEIPKHQPPWLPTGALLKPQTPSAGAEGHHLVLVEVDTWWRPLRHGAIWTWSATAGLARDESWTFRPCEGAGRKWSDDEVRVNRLVYFSAGTATEWFNVPDRYVRDDDLFVGVKLSGTGD